MPIEQLTTERKRVRLSIKIPRLCNSMSVPHVKKDLFRHYSPEYHGTLYHQASESESF